MWFPGSSSSRRRVMYLYVVVVLILVLQQMVGAIRVFPGNAVEFSHHHRSVIVVDNKISTKNHEDLFNKYLGGRRTFAPTTSNTATTSQTGFDESKRRVPSCPDPLHN